MKNSTLQRGRHLAGVALLLALLLTGGNASAANVLRFLPFEQTVDQSAGSVQVDLQMEFDDLTVGGGIDIRFDDKILAIPDASDRAFITFDPNLGDDPGFRCPGASTCPSDPAVASWGNFTNPIGGTMTVLTLDFDIVDLGSTQISATVSATFPFGNEDGSAALEVDIVPAALTIVPEPGTGVLLALGLAGLACRGRRRAA